MRINGLVSEQSLWLIKNRQKRVGGVNSKRYDVMLTNEFIHELEYHIK